MAEKPRIDLRRTVLSTLATLDRGRREKRYRRGVHVLVQALSFWKVVFWSITNLRLVGHLGP